jgi:tetratricopeptide (TPR) repeat protein
MKRTILYKYLPLSAKQLLLVIVLTIMGVTVRAVNLSGGSTLKQKSVYNKLQRLDNIVYIRPEAVLDSLNVLDTLSLSRKNAAYLFLLRTIAEERCGNPGKSDSLILISEKWYRQSKDHKNLFRSLLYKGSVKVNKLNTDSLSYISFIEAEKLLDRYRIDDGYSECVLYRNLGRLNRLHSNYSVSENYLERGLRLCEENKDFREECKLRIELFRTYLVQKKYSEALGCIVEFADIDTLPPRTAFELNNEMSFYHAARGEYDISISYLKNILLMKDRMQFEPNELSSIFYRIATYHNKYKNADSTLYYSKLAAQYATDTLDTRRHFYFKNLAEQYALRGDTASAFENYRIAYKSHLNANSERIKNRILEIERRHALEIKEVQLQKTRFQKGVFITSTLLLLTCLLWVVVKLRKRTIRHREESIKTREKLSSIENTLQQEWLKNEIRNIYSELLPKMLNDVTHESDRQRLKNPAFTSDLEVSLKEVRDVIRNKLGEITKESSFIEIYPYMEELPFLSSMEKIILILFEQDYSPEEIADLLCTTRSSVRGAKGNIKKKVLAAQGLSFDPRTIFTSFRTEEG